MVKIVWSFKGGCEFILHIIILLCLVILTGNVLANDNSRENSEKEIISKLISTREICENLQRNLEDRNALAKLQASISQINDQEIRIYLECAVVMGHLFTRQTFRGRELRRDLLVKHPRHSLLKLIQDENLSVNCDRCRVPPAPITETPSREPGEPFRITAPQERRTVTRAERVVPGEINIDCPRCEARGRCQICQGRGYNIGFDGARHRCSTCRGTGDCANCDGKGRTTKTCRKCNGIGTLITQQKIRDVYIHLLQESQGRLFASEQILRGFIKFEGEWIKPEEKVAIETQRNIEKDYFGRVKSFARRLVSQGNYDVAINQIQAAIAVYQNSIYTGEMREYLMEVEKQKEEALERERRIRRAREAIANAKEIPTVVNGLLESQRRDEVGIQYWDDPTLASKLYAVVDWEIVNESLLGDRAQVKVRIESSTKGGFPIRKIWTFYMIYTDSWKVRLISDD